MQTSVETTMTIGMPGQLADIGDHDVVSRLNNSKQLITTTISAADLSTTLTINGTAFNVNSGAASLTVTELRDLLIAAITAGSEPVTATVNDADELYVEADVAGTAFTYADTVNVASVDIIANETGTEFGLFVTEDVNSSLGDNLAHSPKSATDITTVGKLAGLTVHSHANEQAAANSDNVGYDLASAMSVLRKGRIYVRVEDAVTKTSGVYARHTASGSNTTLGKCRSDDDSSSAGLVPGARYETSADAGGIATVNLNLV